MRGDQIKNLLEKIDYNRSILFQHKPFNQELLQELQQYYRLSLTYSSNALEGNTLTLSETKVAIEDGLTVAGKPIRDYYEATGHAAAFDFMYAAGFKGGPAVTEENICTIHKLFYSGIDFEAAGTYRTKQNFISGTEYIPPGADEVPGLMKEFVLWAQNEKGKIHPIEFAAIAHRKLVDIHPFLDGNGRTARLLMNLCLIKDQYNIISIPPVLRHDYIQALQIAQRDKNRSDEPFIGLIGDCELESQRDYFRLMKLPLPKYDEELTL